MRGNYKEKSRPIIILLLFSLTLPIEKIILIIKISNQNESSYMGVERGGVLIAVYLLIFFTCKNNCGKKI